MENTLLNISEESDTSPYFLIVKINPGTILSILDSLTEVRVFRECFYHKMISKITYLNEIHSEVEKSSVKFGDKDFLFICSSNKNFHNRVKKILTHINETDIFAQLKSNIPLLEEEVEPKLERILSAIFLKESLKRSDMKRQVPRIKI